MQDKHKNKFPATKTHTNTHKHTHTHTHTIYIYIYFGIYNIYITYILNTHARARTVDLLNTYKMFDASKASDLN